MKELSSLQHPLVKHLVKLRQNSDYRYDHQTILLEGTKMIGEVAPSQKFKTVLVSSPDLLPKQLKADEIIIATPEVIKKISGLQSPEGIVAEATMPKEGDLRNKKHLIALDRISDPGNLGTILRTALALGWEGVFLLEEGCDPYNEKCLRASRGAAFKLPIKRGSWKDLQQTIQENRLTAYVADTEGIPFDQIPSPSGILLVLGNEAQGPSEESLSHCKPLTIPMSGKMESLNVAIAAGILLYSLRHHRIGS